ncbi:hypothetical protein PAPYR_1157 [Paratrimastix pyriformis]|uniref:START domain-containing protein n=1 Tax=Paratrimastix pyriformis TaxID=342808 RepID=A0ABQ8UZ05_9EUKA|nr:hypothetical protein PAPYR_1157 [Paratrimastix pyriformis]
MVVIPEPWLNPLSAGMSQIEQDLQRDLEYGRVGEAVEKIMANEQLRASPAYQTILRDAQTLSESLVALEDKHGWTLFASEPTYTIHYRHDGGLVHSICINGSIDASAVAILAQFIESDLYSQWLPHCKESCRLKNVGFTRQIARVRGALPWPFEDRDFLGWVNGYDVLSHGGGFLAIINSIQQPNVTPPPPTSLAFPSWLDQVSLASSAFSQGELAQDCAPPPAECAAASPPSDIENSLGEVPIPGVPPTRSPSPQSSSSPAASPGVSPLNTLLRRFLESANSGRVAAASPTPVGTAPSGVSLPPLLREALQRTPIAPPGKGVTRLLLHTCVFQILPVSANKSRLRVMISLNPYVPWVPQWLLKWAVNWLVPMAFKTLQAQSIKGMEPGSIHRARVEQNRELYGPLEVCSPWKADNDHVSAGTGRSSDDRGRATSRDSHRRRPTPRIR